MKILKTERNIFWNELLKINKLAVVCIYSFFYFFLIGLALYNMTGVYYNSFTIYTDIFGKGCEKYEN